MENALTLLLQIPLAGIVVYVVERFLKYLEAQDERNKEFIKQITADHNASTGRIAEEIKALTAAISEMQGEIIEHNATTNEAISQMRAKTNGKARA